MPARRVKRLKGSEGRSRCLSVEEISRLPSGRNSPLTRAVPMPPYTGPRRKEPHGQKIRDLNFIRMVLTVQAAYAKNGEHPTLPMNTVLTQVLRPLIIAAALDTPIFESRKGES